MKSLSDIAILFFLASVSANPYDAAKVSNSDISERDDVIFETMTTEYPTQLFQGDIIIEDCEELYKLEHNSTKTIITRGDDKIAKCISDFSIILQSDDGILIVLGNALTILHFNEQSKLFFNKYYMLPKHIQDLRYIYEDELVVKAFVTSKLIGEQLYNLLNEAKYKEAVELSKYLHRSGNSVGIEIITNVVTRLLKNENYLVMNYAFQLMENDAKDIVTDCFPPVFKNIFNRVNLKILNKNETAALRLSEDIDYYKDRWLYSDCKSEGAKLRDWVFYPSWNSTIESVVFQIYNVPYEMRLKLNWQTIGHYNSEREAFGDHRPVDDKGRYEWRLIPTGFQEDDNELLFCIVEEVYAAYLIPNDCKYSENDVRGMRELCTPTIGWLIE